LQFQKRPGSTACGFAERIGSVISAALDGRKPEAPTPIRGAAK
jgi:hypothetical protein